MLVLDQPKSLLKERVDTKLQVYQKFFQNALI